MSTSRLNRVRLGMIAGVLLIAAGPAAQSAHARSCNAISQGGFNTAQNLRSLYTGEARLGVFWMVTEMLNQGFGKIPEEIMCHFTDDMGVTVSKAHYPIDFTKGFNGAAIRLTIDVPRESFALAAGYDSKAVVYDNGVPFMTMYWGGQDTSSKGFLLMHNSGLNQGSALYANWDQTNPAAQVIKIWGAQFTSTVLANNNDNNMYGRVTYNATTNSITAQAVLVQNSSSSINCQRIYGTGAKGGTLTISTNTGGTALTSASGGWTTTDNTGFATFSITDAYASVAGVGAQAVALDYSCATVASTVPGVSPISGSDVSDGATQSSVFPF